MKKSLSALVLLVLMVASACTLFKKDIEIPKVFHLDINQPAGAPLQFSVSKIVATADAEVEKYKDDIDVFRIDKITVKVTKFTGTNAPVFTGNLKFAAEGTNTFFTVGEVENANLSALFASGNEVEVPINSDHVKQELINLIKAGTNINLVLEGSTTENPIVATLEIKVYANITVEI